ncbi:MAG: glycoside hydrolase family 3 protein [Alphaproteobacteria bacterium]|nr:glycoside hydrolase family 3 protein [Alphaproteobacteria bacterium]
MNRFTLIFFITFFNFSTIYAATLEDKIGQMIMLGFDGVSAEDESVQQIGRIINEGLIGSVIFYQKNIQSPEQIKNLTSFIKSFAQPDNNLLLAIDQEGGKVQRLKEANGFTNYPSAKEVGNKSVEEAQEIYNSMAKELNEYQFNFNLAPVVDLNYGPSSSAIGRYDRAFSQNPFDVTTYATSFIKSHFTNNVLTCLKHYPGHGSAKGDTHKDSTNVTHCWEEKELHPFYDLKDQQSCAIMTAHIVNVQLDDSLIPATMSAPIIQEKLRSEFGYNGVVITDDLLMNAIWGHYSLEDIVLKTILAGCDILLFSNNQITFQQVGREDASSMDFPKRIRNIVLELIAQDKLTEERIDQSYQRIMAFKNLLRRE